jgi:hypothetical protein
MRRLKKYDGKLTVLGPTVGPRVVNPSKDERVALGKRLAGSLEKGEFNRAADDEPDIDRRAPVKRTRLRTRHRLQADDAKDCTVGCRVVVPRQVLGQLVAATVDLNEVVDDRGLCHYGGSQEPVCEDRLLARCTASNDYTSVS